MRSIILLLCFFIAPSVFAFEIPTGWRLPTEKELSEESLRNKSPTKNAKVEGDFNGDEKVDYAYLLKSTTYSGEGLVIRLSTTSGFSWQVVDEISWGKEYPNVSLVMGIELAVPEKYKTLCGKGYYECESGELEELELKLPGIWHYKFESAASIWYWDSSTNKFKQIWLSD